MQYVFTFMQSVSIKSGNRVVFQTKTLCGFKIIIIREITFEDPQFFMMGLLRKDQYKDYTD